MKKSVPLIIAVIMLFVSFVPVFADQLQEYQSKSSQISSELSKNRSEMQKLQNEKERLKGAIDSLNQAESRAQGKYELLEEDIEELGETIEDYDKEFALSEQRYKDQEELLKKRLCAMSEMTMMSYLDVLLDSKNILDFFDRLELIASIAKKDKQLVEEFKVLKQDMEYKRAIKEEELAYFQDRKERQNQRIQQISASRSDIENDLRNTESDLERLEKRIDELNRQSNEIAETIKKLLSTRKYIGGDMTWPTPSCYTIVSPFGNRLHPILKKYKMHTGIDIDAKYGASIVAANKGTVIMAGWSSGYGYTVIIDHGGGISTLYAHCSSLLVKTGQTVESGQVIAKVGSTGLSTGPHLHFEVRENGTPVNPIGKYFKQN